MSRQLPLLAPDEITRLRGEVGQRSEDLARELTWLDYVDVSQPLRRDPPSQLSVAVFNAERGNRYEGIESLLKQHPRLCDVDVVLLGEVDWGMARSGNRHVARELGAALGLGYAFGVEFLELTKGEAWELECPGDNTHSFHGNAILSRFPLIDTRVVRLPRRCSWAEGSQLRIGGRMALVCEIETAAGLLTLASVHLENRTDPRGRREQLAPLLDHLVGRERAIVAGDLNTSTIDAGVDEEIMSIPGLLAAEPERLKRPEQHEPLFDDVRGHGFLVDEVNPPGVPTNVPMGIMDSTYWLKLDWLFARGVRVAAPPPEVIAAAHGGARVSDHDFVVASFEV